MDVHGRLTWAAKCGSREMMRIIGAVAAAVDEKDSTILGHSERVAQYSIWIGTEMGMSADELESLQLSALLHDVGKISIADKILRKPTRLTADEYEVMKSHATSGASLLRSVDGLRHLLPAVEMHHESMDGLGYPYGLKGTDIPRHARIISVADTFDAMTSSRPYQGAVTAKFAEDTLCMLAGMRYCPDAVEAFCAALRNRVPSLAIPMGVVLSPSATISLA
jgi:HD-GYP domain-containing protein (c-di-GMP phosphodiesterase class II)